MAFPPIFIKWISLCITTASFSVQVNGELAGYFQSERGLRQGCSLSPYLFVISMDILSKMLDKGASAQQFGYHPRCKNIGLTHLSFADDMMVLTDGKVRSIEGIVNIFDEFAKISGLKISMEKSSLYLAGITERVHQEITDQFPFEIGTLPVRYLGLPLVTKRLSKADYQPLLEKIKQRICTWTSKSLSYAGRLNLVSSVLWSIANFWLAAFRLPRECIRDIDKLCSAFLWSGPELNTNKAKVSWEDVCKPKQGGLGLKSLKEANDVCCLKLIWRIISNGPSLWVKWVTTYLLRRESFWSIRETTSAGSWIWRKLLKYRAVAKNFCKCEARNGSLISFWYDNWSNLGCLMDMTGLRGLIDMGLQRTATLAEAWRYRRRRRHRVENLNLIEQALESTWQGRDLLVDDIFLWKGKGDFYKASFSTKDTWNHTRTISNTVAWYKGVWFTHATPKYSFCTWLAMKNRLTTGDRVQIWNPGSMSTCVLCHNHLESRDHLFFMCSYSSEIWKMLMQPLLHRHFSTDWWEIVTCISKPPLDKIHSFFVRYSFQIAIHSIWRERNGRRHGDHPISATQLAIWIEKQIRNKLSAIRAAGDQRFNSSLQAWFASRQ